MENTTLKRPRTMSLNEARSVIWPFRELKGQTFGSLLDKDLLSLQDLGYAAQRAYDVRVRDAARTLMLYLVSQGQFEPESAPGPLNVVSTERRSFAERRQIQLAMLQGAIMGLIFIPLPYLVWLWFNRPSQTDNERSFTEITSSATGIIALVLVLIIMIAIGLGLAYLFGEIVDRLLLNRLNRQLQLYRKGQLGEERVLSVMYGVLDGKWWLYRNVEMPGRRIGDLDFVLVGPHGTWSFEVKAYSGDYRNVGERWEKRQGSKWFTVRKSPTRQARRNASELHQLLAANEIKQWVTPVIIWANPESTIVLDNPSTFVWTLDQLSGRLKDLSSESPVPEAQVEKIVGVLKKIHQDHDDNSL